MVRETNYLRKTSEVPNQRWGMKALVRKIKKKKNSELRDFMVIGIDFGTTYSGAAWATVEDFENDQINLITTWPGYGREEGKAPTELFYEYGNVMWGYDIPADADPVRWFKLLLLRDEDLDPELRASDFVLRGRKMLRELNKSATEVIADYLRCMWDHIMATIRKSRSKSVIAALTFHVVITVPAIWKDYARREMEEAARMAGILEYREIGPTSLTFAPEPEAAALATLCEHGKDINTDDVYVICDAGGGTVDLISYRVGELDPIELHEAVVGTGGLCGGIFIDEAFEAICKYRLGRQWSNLSQAGIKAIMKGEWEYAIKPQYRPKPNDNKMYIVSIPAEAFRGPSINDESRKPVIKNGRIHFASSDIKGAFTHAFVQIEKLVDGQIAKAKEKGLSVKGVILVGGLGSSPYLYDHLQARYKKKKIDILQAGGIRPQTAICRGAIFKGFLDGPSAAAIGSPPVSVVSTIARQSLGLCYQTEFVPGEHLEKDKWWCEMEGAWFANNQVMWYLKKGDNVSKAEPVLHDFYRIYESHDDFVEDNKAVHLIQCADDEPPSRMEGNVKELCTISINDTGITFDSLDEFVARNGRKLKQLNYDVEMVPSGASSDFAVYYQGRKLGSEKAIIEFQ
ncbi:hypothetical protein BJY01DRAFT_159458 [Aspergillus pseudoustus]|uniref:Actin-like ATPase domain-containing protein n=1 Tax=Aspergillus pseudoustus TaxID=1810923 RepID=A0ABR4KY22_9EURO